MASDKVERTRLRQIREEPKSDSRSHERDALKETYIAICVLATIIAVAMIVGLALEGDKPNGDAQASPRSGQTPETQTLAAESSHRSSPRHGRVRCRAARGIWPLTGFELHGLRIPRGVVRGSPQQRRQDHGK
jgi:hypothetical protein